MSTFLQKIFGKPKPTAASSEITQPIGKSSSITSGDKENRYNPLAVTFAASQSIGRQREHNEDALFTYGSFLSYEETQTFAGLFVIADGMGGHLNGEVASGLAVRTVAEQVISKYYTNSIVESTPLAPEAIQVILLDAVQEANRVVKQQVPGGGTTLTALLIYNQNLILTHVGDSRAYWITPAGEAQVLTHDHSFVRQLVDLGQISPEEAAVHPQRNILSMAVGQLEPLKPDYSCQPLPTTGYLMLCSDGLWGVVSEETIVQIILSSNDVQTANQRLIIAANQAGGPDNITVILIRLAA